MTYQEGRKGRMGTVLVMAVDWMAFEPRVGPVPRYRQVAQFISDAVKDKRLQPGEPLPSETALAEYMQVSVDTIRSGLQVLRDEGVVVTAQGLGTFVATK
jgi:DNA-binding GntR family transcriptional regulator